MNAKAQFLGPVHTGRRLLACVLTLGCCACEAQQANDYLGEVLFEMRGSVTLDGPARSDIVPAFALKNEAEGTIHFVEANVTGEFPADFALKVYEPPPQAAIGGYLQVDLPEEPRFTLGRIAAVTRNHEPMLYIASSGVDTLVPLDASCGCAQATCTPCTEEQLCRPDSCSVQGELMSLDGRHQGVITFSCPRHRDQDADLPVPEVQPDCQVTSKSGEPMWMSSYPDQDLAGLSHDYVVLYLETAAAPGTFTAERFGSPSGLGAGYHLIAARSFSDAEVQAAIDCSDRAIQLGVDEYNAQHATSYDTSAAYLFCGSNSQPDCGITPLQLALRGAWYRARVELGCTDWAYHFEPVSDAATAHISVHVGPGEALSF